MTQGLLFEIPVINTDDLKEKAKNNPLECFNELSKRGVEKPNALHFILKEHFESDFENLFEGLEQNNVMVFLEVSIGQAAIKLVEFDMDLYSVINDRYLKIYSCNENDVFDKAYLNKVKSKFKSWLFRNAYQITI